MKTQIVLNVDCCSSLVEQVTLFAYGCIENTKVMPISAMFVLTQFTDACTGLNVWNGSSLNNDCVKYWLPLVVGGTTLLAYACIGNTIVMPIAAMFVDVSQARTNWTCYSLLMTRRVVSCNQIVISHLFIENLPNTILLLTHCADSACQ